MKIHYTEEDIANGLILVDSETGIEFGLTSDKFSEDSYLWLKNNTLHLSNIISKEEHKGHVLNIMNKAKEKGLNMVCLPVSARMRFILEKFGFRNLNNSLWIYNNLEKILEKEFYCEFV